MNKPEEKKIHVSKIGFLGSLAKWSVSQSPYHRPDNLEIVLDKFNAIILPIFGKEYFIKFDDFKQLNTFIKEHLRTIPEYMKWNERKNGNQAQYSFSSRYDTPHPDNDFIDLDALERNITREIINDQIE